MARLLRGRLPARVPLLLLLLGAGACAGSPGATPAPVPEPETGWVDWSLFLIGDAGEPAAGGEPVLRALTAELRGAGPRSTVVFLGDNVYPRGLPDSTSTERAEMERRLDAQIEAVLSSGAHGIFVPGTHDWEKGGAGGWAAILRQGRHLDARGYPRVALIPRSGCPGPVTVDMGHRLRLVVLDTQWLLHRNQKPGPGDRMCPAATREAVLDSLRSALASAGDRRVVVAAHHPLLSTGPHGGHFTVRQHLFPLTDAVSWLYLPLPIVGSLYPLARTKGISSQDESDSGYRSMIAGLRGAFVGHPPLVYAAGHDHNLEVLEGRVARYLLVSGAGIYGHTDPAGGGEGVLYAAARSGFMRLDVLAGGRVRLGVLVVDASGSAREAFSMDLE